MVEWFIAAGRSAHPPSSVAIPESVIVTPFDCFYYPPPQLAADGYRIINSAWTPLYIAGQLLHKTFMKILQHKMKTMPLKMMILGRPGGSGQSPELIYKWNP